VVVEPGEIIELKVTVSASVFFSALINLILRSVVLVKRQSPLSKQPARAKHKPMNKKARKREFFVRKYTF